MEEDLQIIKKLESLNLRHQELDNMIDTINSEKFKDEFQLHRLKKEKLMVRDEISKLQDAIYPDIIA
ncbi:MAG: YdcH family protein [Pseudomonadota bacterium]